MTQKSIIITILVLALLGVGVYALVRNNPSTLDPNDNGNVLDPNTNGGNDLDNTPIQHAMIRVTSPLPNTQIESPLTITGEARGGWYFEATFPVKILDADGRVLGQHYAEAQGEWMTNDFVPFRSTLSFSTPTTPTGTLVIEKSNASGLPENADEIRIPIRFEASGATQTKTIKLFYYSQNADKDATGNIKCSADGLIAINRVTPVTITPIQDAIRELLKGPTAAERASLPGTEFPLAGVTLSAASLNNGVLTLTFNDPQGKTSGGSCRVQILSAQIEATAKQFAGVNSVRLMPESTFQP